MIKVMIIFGTRPEAIKVAPIIKELQKREETTPIVCVTAQHREMLDQVLEYMKIKPDYDLNIMKQGQTLSEITTRALTGLEEIIKKEQPDIVLVQGDTTTTLAGALAAFYNMVPVGHIEAGLRTYKKYSPFPEEINRQIVSRIADFNFAPTELAKNNLKAEGIEEKNIFVTGNTATDALKLTVSKEIKQDNSKKIILLTVHRRENIGQNMENIFKAIKRIAQEYKDIKIIYPMHKNPKVREIAKEILKEQENIEMIEPLEVIEFHNLINKCYMILTDSGGIQEEAPSLNKPVLVLRDTTERPEGIEAGTLKLVGTEEKRIYEEAKRLLEDKQEYERMSKAPNPYGDGYASERIVDIIIKKLEDK